MSELRIAFVGQCHTTGYPGVPPDTTFPEVCRAAVGAMRPGVSVTVDPEPYYHPIELPRAIDAALQRRPRVAVIEVVGWLAIRGSQAVDLSRLPPGLRTAYERIRYLRHVANRARDGQSTSSGVQTIATDAVSLAGSFVASLLPRYPRPTIEEYEALVRLAVRRTGEAQGASCVVQGPGAPNVQLASQSLSPAALDLYRRVHAMARRVAEEEKALFVDRWDTISAGFFRDGSIRPSVAGHSVWGQLLANELLAAGLV